MWYPQPSAKNCLSHPTGDRNAPPDPHEPPISIPCPCSTACCTGSWWPSSKQKLSAQLPCTSGKGTYLTQDVHGQVHQPKNVALVPWVQHADVVGYVVGAALHPSQGGILKPDTLGSCQEAPRLLTPCLRLVEEAPMHPSACPASLLAHRSQGQVECWWHRKPHGKQNTHCLCRGPELRVPWGRRVMHQWGRWSQAAPLHRDVEKLQLEVPCQ